MSEPFGPFMPDEQPPTTSLDEEWCTINGAARRLGVTATAIRNRIKRGTLETRPNGNFGKLVRVPLAVTVTPDEPVTVTVSEPVTPTVTLTPEERVTLTVTLTVLQGHIERLESELADAKERAADRDVVASQLEALRAVLDLERQRTEEWKSVADRFAQQAERLAARRWWPFRRSA
jgi:hypothetical protein